MTVASPPQQVKPAARPRAAAAAWRPKPLDLALLVLALTLLAGAIRLQGLAGPDGALNTDETRLAMAADGVLGSGVPVMPSGRVYTRGMLNGYLIAGSFALLGRHDFAARLPSALAGALLVPLVFLLGQAYSGPAAGLAAAAFAVLADRLVYYSQSAWLPSIFLLLFTAGVYCCYRGFVERRGRWQVAGAGCFVAALLSYEFAVLLLGGLGFYLVWRAVRGDWSWYRGPTTLVALGLFLSGLGLFVVLALALRAGTLTGPLGEVRAWLTPRFALSGIEYYLKSLLADYLVLVGLAALGLPLLAKARPRGTTFLLLLAILVFLVPSFITQLQRSPRYILPLLPLLAVLAGGATVHLARRIGHLAGMTGRLRTAWPLLALLALFGWALSGDVQELARRYRQPPPGPTWLQSMQAQGIQPTDLLVAESANKSQFYLGRAEYYLRPLDYARYAYPDSGALRYVYTGAILLLERGDFERYVEQPNPGRTVWVFGRADRLPDRVAATDPDLWPSLVRSADRVVNTPDGWVLLRLTLPRRAGSAPS